MTISWVDIKTVTMVGSRNILPIQRDLFIRLGKYFCEQECEYRSGLAEGSDLSSFYGFKNADNYIAKNASNYVVGERWFHTEIADGTIKPLSMFSDELLNSATELALEARGSFHGLTPYSEKLHIRNAFQVLGDDLQSPTDLIILCAQPFKNKVMGGTNTAFSIAKKYNIPHLNIFLKEDYAIARRFIMERGQEEINIDSIIEAYENDIMKYYPKYK